MSIQSSQTPCQVLLSRLGGVRRRSYVPTIRGTPAANAYEALCPAHNDKNPSLSILERSDNSLTLRCWAGCSLDEILGALGLQRRHLFPANGEHQSPYRERKNQEGVLGLLTMDLRAVAIGLRMFVDAKLTDAQIAELLKLCLRVIDVIEDAHGR